jgi:outer membrane protein assembly factor BamB
MKKHIISLLVLFLLLSTSFAGVSNQKTNVDSNKSETSTNGGLMDSAWPMFHHDTRHMGRCPNGPDGNWPTIKWKFRMEGLTLSSPAIDENGTIYIGEDGIHNSYFYAINSNGSEKWHFNPGDWVMSSPAISSDGTIYFGSLNGNLNAVYLNGTTKWIISLGEGWVYSSPAIGDDGTIYGASVNSNRLCAVYPNGTIKWYFYAEDLIYCSPAIGDDETIYVGSNDGYMYAVYPNGTMKWRFYAGGEKGIGSAPSIADDGTIYFGGTSGYLYALYPNGTLRWKFGTGYIGESSPAISNDGTIYVGDQVNNRIYSIDEDGTLNWYYTTNGEIISSPAIDKNGIIYCGSTDGYLYALNPNGTLRWRFDAGDYIESSVSIGEDGTIYIAAQFDSQESYTYLYALEMINHQFPSIPTINGPSSGKAKQNYNYTIVSTDSEVNDISYYVNWGDGTNTGWIGPYDSGEEQTVSHTWDKKGTYTIQAKAKDGYGAESNWGTLSVTMPFSYNILFLQFWMRFFQQFPHIFPILRHFLTF